MNIQEPERPDRAQDYSQPVVSGGSPVYQPPQPVRPHKRRVARIFGLGLVAVVVLVLSYGAYLAIIVAKISTNPVDLSGLASDASGRTNILVLGVGDPGHAAQNLSDTIMVVSVDTKSQKVAEISIPRDLRVPIPGYGSGKINAAHADGGVPVAEQTVSNVLGIPIHYYVKTNFSGLKSLVDAVGGLDITVKTRLYDPDYPCDDNQYQSCGLDIAAGRQHMDGAKVLQYVRCRKGTCGNDFGRAARQQEVINLLRQKVLRWDVILNPVKLNPIVAAVRQTVVTDMGAFQAAELGGDIRQSADKNEPVSLVLSTARGGYLTGVSGSSDLVPIGGDFSAIAERVQNIFGSAANPDMP